MRNAFVILAAVLCGCGSEGSDASGSDNGNGTDSSSCVPTCIHKSCGDDDGCGGRCSDAGCPAGLDCIDNSCRCSPTNCKYAGGCCYDDFTCRINGQCGESCCGSGQVCMDWGDSKSCTSECKTSGDCFGDCCGAAYSAGVDPAVYKPDRSVCYPIMLGFHCMTSTWTGCSFTNPCPGDEHCLSGNQCATECGGKNVCGVGWYCAEATSYGKSYNVCAPM